MPTLEVQLAKAQKDMDALVDSGVVLNWWGPGLEEECVKIHCGLCV